MPGAGPFRLEYRLRRRGTGPIAGPSTRRRPRLGSEGEFLGYIGSVIDIHERRDVEDGCARARSATDAVQSIDSGFASSRSGGRPRGDAADYRLIEVNPAF